MVTWVSEAGDVENDLFADKSCIITMTKVHKLFQAATWHMPDAIKNDRQIFDPVWLGKT